MCTDAYREALTRHLPATPSQGWDSCHFLTDRGYLTGIQYRDDTNLAARQAIYRHQEPRIDLVASVLDLAGLTGQEIVTEIGCGNGPYLAGLSRRGHMGRLLGVDLSPGMLATTRAAVPSAAVTVGDAQRLPLSDGAADVVLAPHMLYHVPDRAAAIAEFRRVTKPGGRLLVTLNGTDHVAELGELAAGAAAALGLPDRGIRAEYQANLWMTLDAGQQLLSGSFETVERHDFVGQLVLPGPEPVARYIASMRATQAMPDAAAFTTAAVDRIPFGRDGTFRVTTHTGLLICC
ncbi:MAG TPA: class I SAM-dependent methyltransferase [Streptosporangiaceae bacterium]|nr:class I SAM-dependent methyltransferase [Streptosporangiaceae bacterium]